MQAPKADWFILFEQIRTICTKKQKDKGNRLFGRYWGKRVLEHVCYVYKLCFSFPVTKGNSWPKSAGSVWVDDYLFGVFAISYSEFWEDFCTIHYTHLKLNHTLRTYSLIWFNMLYFSYFNISSTLNVIVWLMYINLIRSD